MEPKQEQRKGKKKGKTHFISFYTILLGKFGVQKQNCKPGKHRADETQKQTPHPAVTPCLHATLEIQNRIHVK